MNRFLIVLLGLLISTGCQKTVDSEPKGTNEGSEPERLNFGSALKEKDEKHSISSQAGRTSDRTEHDGTLIPGKLSAPQRQRLKTLFQTLWCIQKRNDRSGLNGALESAGYKDLAAWGSDWHKASQMDPDWVDSVVAMTTNLRCSKKTP